MPSEQILVIEDERAILEMVTYNLRKEGYKVIDVNSGEAGLQYLKAASPDLILLDLMLPGQDGLEICRKVKGNPQTEHIPIIMVTAKGEEPDIVAGLELGADDYVPKPFSPKVLSARVRAVLRRKKAMAPGENEPIVLGPLSIHPGKHEVKYGATTVKLTQTEFKILHILARRPGWVMTRSQIVEDLHDGYLDVTERSIDVQIVGLRKKLGEAGGEVETVRGVGYRLKEPE